MSLSDELHKLHELHERGVLSADEFARAKSRLLQDDGEANVPQGVAAINAFKRSRSDRWFGGVCGGLGAVTGLASWMWRLIFGALFLCGGAGLLIYVLMWIFVPSD